ncbi:epoxide hydrolase [Streptomyces olindensis]|nr:epoxide hydrolase [Streptomyces olindensis]
MTHNTTVSHRTLEVNGIQLHIAEQGEGPLVVLLHGFPETWYSWRHQFTALAEAGYRVVAPDQRGYGSSDRPEAIDSYTMFHLVGDVIGLIHALGEEQAVVAGHDFGAIVAWQTALLRPDVVRGVVGLSVSPWLRGDVPPLKTMRELHGGEFYWNYYEQPGVAEAELSADTRSTLRRILYHMSGDNPENKAPQLPLVPPGDGLLTYMAPEPEELPGWLTEDDIDAYVAGYTESGFGGLSLYRNFDRNWELGAAWAGAKLQVPGLYVTGDRDLAFALVKEQLPVFTQTYPTIAEPVVLPGCGHWTQQERPEEVNAQLIDFLRSLESTTRR